MKTIITTFILYRIYFYASIVLLVLAFFNGIQIKSSKINCSNDLDGKSFLQILERCNETKIVKSVQFYDRNCRFIMLILCLSVVLFNLDELIWNVIYKIKITDLDFKLSKSFKSYDQKIIEIVVDYFKNNKKINFLSLLLSTLIGFVKIILIFLIITYLTFENRSFFQLGLYYLNDFELNGILKNDPNYYHLYARNITFLKNLCYHNDINCRLELNSTFEFTYLLIWIFCLLLAIIISISLCQLILLNSLKHYRVSRILELIPSIDKIVVIEIASNLNSYYILEYLNSKLKKENFKKLVDLLFIQNSIEHFSVEI